MNELKSLLANFESILEQSTQKVWEAKNLPINLETMANEATKLSEALIAIGDYYYNKSAENSTETTDNQKFIGCWINFEWAISAKSFLVLWRDVLFQQQKGQIVKIDRLTTSQALRTLNLQSQETLDKSIKDLIEDVDRALNIPLKNKTKKVAQWKLQQNPWPIYKQQIQEIPTQCLRLQKEYRILLNVASKFYEIEDLVRLTESFCTKEIATVKKIAEETIAEIEKEEIPKLSKIAVHLEDLETGISLPHHFNFFTDALEQLIDALVVKKEVPVSAKDGIIIVKEIYFKRSTKQWLDGEVLPLLYEVWELTENTHNGLKMALMNIKNRAILLSTEEKEGKIFDYNQEAIGQPLKIFTKNWVESKESMEKLCRLIDNRLAKDFNASAIYDLDREFLPVLLQATLNQFLQSQNKIQNRLSNWFKKQWIWVQNIRESVEQEDALSNGEKVVRLIKSRTGDVTNSNYSSVFLTKGFIGESFSVGRKQELAHAKIGIDNWKAGFRGAVVITGQRFSGKTILGELIAKQFFDKNTIRLTPNSLIKYRGRRMTTTFDLKAALKFIRKYARDEPPLIWIDDMELWWDKDLPLIQNVRELHKFIDNYSNRLFFLVSMSNWLKAHLNLFQETSKIFQAEINVDYMPPTEIREAIMIRHGATHKILINEEGEKLSLVQFRKQIDNIYRITRGNIGEALNRWSCSTSRIDQDRVFNQGCIIYDLPNFLNPDEGILLTAIMMEKRTSEYRLRKLFGPAFTHKYSLLLQRLIGIGLLKRQLDDWLEINEVVVNDLGKMLEEKGYLKFHRLLMDNG